MIYTCCGCRISFKIELTDVYWNPLFGRGPDYPNVNSTEITYCPTCGHKLDYYIDEEGVRKDYNSSLGRYI